MPLESGRFPLQVTVRDHEPTTFAATIDLIILEQLHLVILTDELPAGFVDEPYGARLKATLPAAVWRVIGGELPPGIELAHDGALSGIPTDPGAFTFHVEVEGRGGLARPDLLLTVLVRVGGGGGSPGTGGGGAGTGPGAGGGDPRGSAGDPGAGSGRGAGAPAGGCDCSSTSGELGLAGALVLLGMRVRRRHRA